jgi:hypothetical protein
MSLTQRIFRNISAGSALAAARDALAQTEQRLAALESERAQKLTDADGDYLAETAAIDQQIRSLQANAIVHRDRIPAMDVRPSKQEHARREEEKAAFIGKLKKALPRRQAAVEGLDAALKEVAEAFKELAAADDALFASWPDVMPPADRYSYLRADRIPALSPMRKHRPMAAGLIRELVNRVPFDFAAEVEKRSRELIEELEGSSVPASETAA